MVNEKASFSYWKRRVFWGVSLTYGAFYLCRFNISVALLGIAGETGYSKTVLGGIGSGFFILYALGQLINGQLGDRVSPRLLILIGLIGSSLLNILFGLSSVILTFLVLWGANGYFQSMGWGPSIKILASWFSLRERGKVSGFMAFFYQTGNILSWLLAAYLIRRIGWRWAFFIPGIILLMTGVYFFNWVKNTPQEAGFPSPNNMNNQKIKSIFRQGVGNPQVLRVAISYFFLSITTYGLLFWLPIYLFSVEKISISLAACQSVILPFSGAISGILTGWMTDKFFSSRRVPLSIIMLLFSLPLILLFPHLSFLQLKLVLLFFLGFLIYGPHMLMVGTMPMDYGTEKTASSSAGFIDSLGYLGAAIGGIGVGYITDHYSWIGVFIFWGICVLLSCFCLLPMWKNGSGLYSLLRR